MTPFISVILPTKNRSHILGQAIQSVLCQSFQDFELIVVDNDDDPNQTKEVVSQFQDERLHYLRTNGKLWMPDNWEYGLKYAQGKIVTILEDKQIFYPNAFKYIYQASQKTNFTLLSWHIDTFDDSIEQRPILIKHQGTGDIQKISSDTILQDFFDNATEAWSKLPRMINCAVRREIIETIKEEYHLPNFFTAVNPDLCAGFILTNFLDHTHHTDVSLSVCGHLNLSNAVTFRKKEGAHKRILLDIGNKEALYQFVPIKSYYIITNSILNDFRRLKQQLPGRIQKYDLSCRDYILACYNDILRTKYVGGNIDHEIQILREFLFHQDPATLKKINYLFFTIRIKHYLKWLLRGHPLVCNFIFKTLRYKMKILTQYHSLNEMIDNPQLKINLSP